MDSASNSFSRNKIRIDSSFSAFILVPCLFVICLVFSFVGVDVYLTMTTMFFLVTLYLCFKSVNKNIFFILFLCSFYIFLISGDIAQAFTHKTYYLYLGMAEEPIRHSHIATFISMVFLSAGFLLTKAKKPPHQEIKEVSNSRINSYRKITSFIFLLQVKFVR